MKRMIPLLLCLALLLAALPGPVSAETSARAYNLPQDLGACHYDMRDGTGAELVEEYTEAAIRDAWSRMVSEGIIRQNGKKYDLDKNGSYDVEIASTLYNNSYTIEHVVPLRTRNLSGDYAIAFPAAWISEWKQSGAYYCSAMIFHFADDEDLGMFTVDLREGPCALEIDTSKQANAFNYALSMLFDNGKMGAEQLPDQGWKFDLDLDGVYDVETGINDNWETIAAALPETKLTGAVTLRLTTAECQPAFDEPACCYSALTFIFPGGSVNPFTDVKEGDFDYDAVLWACYHNPQITNGTSQTRFSPNEGCTRGQVVTFLWRAMGRPEPASFSNPFKDVKPTDYYYKAVRWAAEMEITTGTSRTQFSPQKSCTRGQVVTFLYRAMHPPFEELGQTDFTDVNPQAFYYVAMCWAVRQGITKGTSATTFGPDKTCTRGQVVTFLYRAMQTQPAEPDTDLWS